MVSLPPVVRHGAGSFEPPCTLMRWRSSATSYSTARRAVACGDKPGCALPTTPVARPKVTGSDDDFGSANLCTTSDTGMVAGARPSAYTRTLPR